MKNNVSPCIFLLVALILLVQKVTFAQSSSDFLKPIPDKESYSEFLLSDWKDGAPTLIAFKDPRCGYCIKALQQRARLANYNVFLFWSPILGTASNHTVDAIFKCKKPLGEEVLDKVMLRESIDCNNPENTSLRQLNDLMVAKYQPNFVPQYWFGGKRQTFSQLSLSKSQSDLIKHIGSQSKIKVPWQRYASLALNSAVSQDKSNIALVLPENMQLADEAINSLKDDIRLNWFLLSSHSRSNIQDLEFRMLNNIQKVDSPLFILEGKLLSVDEQRDILPIKTRELIVSSQI